MCVGCPRKVACKRHPGYRQSLAELPFSPDVLQQAVDADTSPEERARVEEERAKDKMERKARAQRDKQELGFSTAYDSALPGDFSWDALADDLQHAATKKAQRGARRQQNHSLLHRANSMC